MGHQTPRKICFAALDAYGLFRPEWAHPFGGSELRAWHLAVGLARSSDIDVSFVVLDHGQPAVERIGNVTVYRHPHLHAGSTPWRRLAARSHRALRRLPRFPYIRPREMRIPLLWEAPLGIMLRLWDRVWSCASRLRPGAIAIGDFFVSPQHVSVYADVDADAYCVFGVGDHSAEIAAWCRRAEKRSVLFTCSDADFSPEYVEGAPQVNAWGSLASLCRYAVMNSDVIVTQSATQSRLLRERFGRESRTVPSPIDLALPPDCALVPMDQRPHALWVGKSDRVKRPELLVEIARACPEVPFVAVVNRVDPECHDRLLRDRPPNVELLERETLAGVERLFSRAFVLINTSVVEGFPNTFLQAGKYRLPVLSYDVDPDGVIEAGPRGIVAHGDFTRLVSAARSLHQDRALAAKLGAEWHTYVRENHDWGRAVDVLRSILTDLS